MSIEMIGVIFSVSVFASLAGAVVLAPLSDRFGRRPMMIASSLLLCVCSAAMPLVTTPMGLIGLRLLIGLAYGAAVPVTFALVAEFAPPHRRALLIIMTSSGVGLGYILAGLVSATVIPIWGWKMLMYGLGASSLVVVVALIILLPESPAFVTRRAQHRARPATQLAAEPERRETIFALLKQPYSFMTLFIWITVVSIYGVEFMLGYWLPTLLMNQGYSISSAGYVTAIGRIGGIVGSLLIGWMMDRWGIARVLSKGFALGALLVCLLPFTLFSPMVAVFGILAASFALSGTFAGSQALTVTSYPPAMRATATGWISGFGRCIGGGTSALIGGAMLGAGYGIGAICLLLAAWLVTGYCSLFALGRYQRSRADRPQAQQLVTAAK